ncbi:MAG: hypothetical protein JWQ54_35, partial [Mucilaginibacter sp.]|nr:hypothetical protein [Mucilaginibacter sp.]
MPKLLESNGKYSIKLHLSHALIRTYKLYNVVNTLYDYYVIDIQNEGTVAYTFQPTLNLSNSDFPA